MAIPLSASTLLAALRAEGCKVIEYRSWRTNNRNHKGAWGPANGVMIHHTVSSGEDSSVALCYNGHADLPGPLCHTVGGKSGKLYMVGNGRANHAGLGDSDVLRAVINETALPVDNETDADGNSRFYGLEIVNLGNGKDQYPAVQYDAAVRWAAAICRAHGWGAGSVIGHKEWQPGKIDPRGPVEGRGDFSMSRFRSDVAERLRHPASWSPGTTPTEPTTIPPTSNEEDPMPTPEEYAAAVWKYPIENQFRKDAQGRNRRIAAQDYLEYGDHHHDQVMARLTALAAVNGELVKTVAQLAAGIGDLDPAAIVTELKQAIEAIDIRIDVPDA